MSFSLPVAGKKVVNHVIFHNTGVLTFLHHMEPSIVSETTSLKPWQEKTNAIRPKLAKIEQEAFFFQWQTHVNTCKYNGKHSIFHVFLM